MPKKTRKAKSDAALRRKKMDTPAKKHTAESGQTSTQSGFRYEISFSEKTKPTQAHASSQVDESLYVATKKDIMTTVIYAVVAVSTLIVISIVLP